MKNIPIPSRFEYQKMLTLKLESFVRRLRWKMIFIAPTKEDMNNNTFIEPKNTYGFRSEAKPRPVPQLEKFEEDLFDLVRSLEFRKLPNNPLQREFKGNNW